MTTKFGMWHADMDGAYRRIQKSWNDHYYGGKPLPNWKQESFIPVSRLQTDKRLLLVCVKTGRTLAACVNQDALDAATRLLGIT